MSSTGAALIGATASGKSALALTVAAALNAEIISVDAGAVYRGMDIGTAKPDDAMRRQVPHHLIDITDPDDSYNVARFYHDAVAAAAAIRARGRLPLFVGGSMMYFNTLLSGLSRQPPVSRAAVNALRAEARAQGIAPLYARLQRAAPEIAATLNPNDSQRIIRALSLCSATLPTPPPSPASPLFPPLKLTLALLAPADRSRLRRRIAARLAGMWENGLLEETQRLLTDWHLDADAPPLKLAGYRQAIQHLSGITDDATMRQKAYYATCQLAKRQLTWLNKWRAHATVIDPFAVSEAACAEQLIAQLQRGMG